MKPDWLVGAPIAVGTLIYVMQPLLARLGGDGRSRVSAGLSLLTALLCLNMARLLPESATSAFLGQRWVLSAGARPLLMFVYLVTAVLLAAAATTAEGGSFSGPALASTGLLSAVILLVPFEIALVLLPAALAVPVLAVSSSASDTRGPYSYLGMIALPIPVVLAALALLDRLSLFPGDIALAARSALLIVPCAILWLTLFPFQEATRLWVERAGALVPAFLWTVKDAAVIYLLLALWRQYPVLRTQQATVILGIVGLVTAVTSGVWASAQSNPAALLACAATSELGIVTQGLMARSEQGAEGGLFLLVSRAAAVLLSTCALLSMRSRPARHGSSLPASLYLETALTFASYAVGILALAGVPPLAGFVGRRYVYAALPATGNSMLLAWRAASLGIMLGLVRVGWSWWRRRIESAPGRPGTLSLVLMLVMLLCVMWLALHPQSLWTPVSDLAAGWPKPPPL